MKWIGRLTAVICVAALLIVVVACGTVMTPEEKQAAQQKIQQLESLLESQRVTYQVQLKDPEKAPQAAETLNNINDLERLVALGKDVLERSVTAEGEFNPGPGAAAIGAALPPPWNLLVGIGLPVIVGIGAHVIKVGLAPIITDLMERGIITAVAMNGAGIIHDF